jgi:tRNA-dihydrouridine synthase B
MPALRPPLDSPISALGNYTCASSARKHIGWYVRGLPGGQDFRAGMNTIEDSATQLAAVRAFFDALGARTDRLPPAAPDAIEEIAESDA